MMALSAAYVKTGKRGYRAWRGYLATFSRLFKCQLVL
jgi:hypothetical protein